MFDRLGRLVLRARVPIVLAWLLLTMLAALAPSLASVTSSEEQAYLPSGSPARVAAERLAVAFPDQGSDTTATVVFSRPDGVLSDTDRVVIAATEAWLRGPTVPAALADVFVSVEGASDVPGYAAMYRSADGSVELVAVRLAADPFGAAAADAVAALRAYLSTVSADGLETAVTGTAAISGDYLDAVIRGTDRTTLVTVVLVIVILLLIYRAPIAAVVPLLTIGAAFAVARAVLTLLAMAGWQVPSLLDTFSVVLVFGVGTDYAIFLLSRYREELGRASREDAAAVTVGRIGAVITASAATVVVGLSSMAAASFGMFQTIGPALAITVVVTLVAGLTLTPALAALAGRWLYWPRHEAAIDGGGHAPGRWDRLAAYITRRPGRVAAGVIALLAVPLLALPSLNLGFDTIEELPTTIESRQGFDQVAEHFDRGQLLPVNVLLEAPAGVDLGSPAGLAELARIGESLAGVDGVRSVRSLVTPAGDGVIPDGMRPSSRLSAMADGLRSGDSLGALTALGDPETLAQIDLVLGYLDALGAAYPDVAVAEAFVQVQTDADGLRNAVAAYQAATDGSAERSAALTGALGYGTRLPDEVGTLADILRARPDDLFLPRSLAGSDPTTARLIATYLAPGGGAMQLNVITADEPYSAAAFATVHRVRATLDERVASSPEGAIVARASVGGATATSADVQSVITEDFKLVGLITVVGVLLVLTLLLRCLVAPLYLVGTVLLSYGTTMGIATLLFQGLLDQGAVNYLVPLIVFVLLVALGSDYNIFLMSRVREESAKAGLLDGITTATARTGTVITSAGIILAGTFVALTVAPLQILQQLGLTVAIGVLIDTFVVRSLLIPALTALVGERAWWPSMRRRRGAATPHPSVVS